MHQHLENFDLINDIPLLPEILENTINNKRLNPTITEKVNMFFFLKSPISSFKLSPEFPVTFNKLAISIITYLSDILDESIIFNSDKIKCRFLQQFINVRDIIEVFSFNIDRILINDISIPKNLKTSLLKKSVNIDLKYIQSMYQLTPPIHAQLINHINRILYTELIRLNSNIHIPGFENIVTYISTDELVQLITKKDTITMSAQILNLIIISINIIINRIAEHIISASKFQKKVLIDVNSIFNAVEFIIDDPEIKKDIFRIVADN